jgi:hypothetical protein
VLGSIAFHVLVIVFFVGREIVRRSSQEWRDTHSPGAPGKAGGGGGQTFRIELPAYHPAEEERAKPVEQPPVPQVVVKPPPIKVQKLEMPSQTGTVTSSVDVSSLGQGPGKGGGAGTGVGPGIGADSGKGTGGQGGDTFPPKQKYAILPPIEGTPASVKGKAYQVHFWINADGRVTAVRVDPEIRDASYRQKFLATMRDYTFEPARKFDGTRIEGEMTITITL